MLLILLFSCHWPIKSKIFQYLDGSFIKYQVKRELVIMILRYLNFTVKIICIIRYWHEVVHSNSHAEFFCFNNIFVKRSKFVSNHKISQQGKSEFIFKFLLTCAFFKFSRATCIKSFTFLKIQIVYLIINQHYLSKIIINLKCVTCKSPHSNNLL
jgi:hypothetical protein